ncbi:MAG: guanylate kinase [Gammaproteobacteria bacterium]|nr:guanylate kinase [Gammaproteobacteria bacterium]
MSRPVASLLIVIAAPSGAGKTSLVDALAARSRNLTVSVSYTTRPRRPGESDGDHYHFVDPARFEQMSKDGAFLEHADVYGNAYGTSLQEVTDTLASGCDVLLEIDWQGARQVRDNFIGDDGKLVSIFILPPSREALKQRLQTRAQDDDAVIERRMANAVCQMSHCREFDHIVINDRFETAITQISEILDAERAGDARRRSPAQISIDGLLKGA